MYFALVLSYIFIVHGSSGVVGCLSWHCPCPSLLSGFSVSFHSSPTALLFSFSPLNFTLTVIPLIRHPSAQPSRFKPTNYNFFEHIAIGACIFHLRGGKPSAHNNLEVIRLRIIKLRIKTMDVNNNFVLPSPSKTKICK